MTRLLLDTTVLVDAERGSRHVDAIADDADDVAIAAITVAELLVGADMAQGRRRTTRRAFVDDIVATVPVLPYDLAVARAHAALLVAVRREGRPRGAHDLVIAATAVASDRELVSADRSAFAGLAGVHTRIV
jgi:tRNA(fMet)-specific endonuclease VapC